MSSSKMSDEAVLRVAREIWAEVTKVAPVAPVAYADGTLTVATVSRAWHTELRLMSPDLMEQLNTAFPAPLIRQIRIRQEAIRILVTGSRTWTDTRVIDDALLDAWNDAVQLYDPSVVITVVHGACPHGADSYADAWASRQDRQLVFVEPHPADWKQYGRGAGFRRNAQMIQCGAHLCLAFIKDGSAGATHTADLAEQYGIPTRRYVA